MAKQRPVPPGGRKPANTRDRQANPARPQPAPAPPGPRRPPAAGDPSDPRPIAAPFMQHPLPAGQPSPTHQPAPQHNTPPMPGHQHADAPPRQTDHLPSPAYPQQGLAFQTQADPAGQEQNHEQEQEFQGHTDHEPDTADLASAYPDPTTPTATDHVRAEDAAPPPSPDATEAAGRQPASRTPAPTRTSGRPMPSPRRTPPMENAAPAGRVSPSAPDTTPPEDQAAPATHPQPRNGPPAAAARPGSQPADLPGPDRSEDPGHRRSNAGNQHVLAPAAARRNETVGIAKVPQARPLLPGLQLQPLVHVDDMAAAVAFYEKLGGEINHGDRSGEWVLMQVGTAQIGLVTRPPNASRGESTVELNFAATMPLDRLEQMLRAQGVAIVEMTADRDLGMQLHVETPEGMPIKIHQVEPELMV
jgi:predicted enzyme related to lactoylglutathione lyase